MGRILTSTAGNPLFHWSCMKLKELFGIKEILNPHNAREIWDIAGKFLEGDRYYAFDIIKRFGVEMLCTSDDLLDTLEHHAALTEKQNGISCLPSLRSDSIITFNQPLFYTWLEKLQSATGTVITSLDTYKTAIIQRLDFFDQAGCLLSDHALDSGFGFIETDTSVAAGLFKNVLNKETPGEEDLIRLQSHLLHFLGTEYAKRKWKMQLHIGAYRYTSTLLREKTGPAGGYSCIGNTVDVPSICRFLDRLDMQGGLPKTILYILNPADNAVFASITGSYAEDGVQGKIQYGPAWWFNDHGEGITQQLIALSNYGLLSLSIGMTTDSRSLLSFLRHNYFRRVLCNFLGLWIEEGKLPDDPELMSTMVKNISYFNIKNWIKK